MCAMFACEEHCLRALETSLKLVIRKTSSYRSCACTRYSAPFMAFCITTVTERGPSVAPEAGHKKLDALKFVTSSVVSLVFLKGLPQSSAIKESIRWRKLVVGTTKLKLGRKNKKIKEKRKTH